MSINQLRRRLAAIFKREQLDQQLDDELRYHLERDAEENVEAGMSPEDAHYAALKAFGNVDLSREQARDARGVNFIDNLLRDIRYSLRILKKNPTFSIVAIVTLTLGIGANTAIFSLVDAILLRSLPVKAPDQLVLFGKGLSVGRNNGVPFESTDLFSYPFYKDVQKREDIFQDVAAQLSLTWTVHGAIGSSDVPQRLEVQLVSGSYFKTLGVVPQHGRLIGVEDDQASGMNPVAVVSSATWKQQFGGDAGAVGKTIKIDKTIYTIIGVGPSNFSGTTVGQAPDLWVPLSMEPQMPPAHWDERNNKRDQSLYLVGRLRDGVSRDQANAAMSLMFKQFVQDLAGPQPSADDLRSTQSAYVELTPAGKGINGVRGDFALPLKVLMGVVGIILLISCANIANLLLARAAVRKKEVALRLALGAKRVRLVRQLITESLMLAALAGAAGFVLAWWGTGLLITMASSGPRPIPLDVTPNIRILVFTLLASVLAAVFFGAVPALRATKVDLNASLKEGKGTIAVKSQNRLGKLLVMGQVALSLMLMVGAGLFVRTLINLQSIDTGFNDHNAMLFEIDTATAALKAAPLRNMLVDIENRVRQLPGVQAAAFSLLMFNQGGMNSPIFTFDETPPQGDALVVRQNLVGVDYFKAMGIPVIAGRDFSANDNEQAPKIAVISEALAHQFYPAGNAIGKRFGDRPNKRDEYEIVGIVKDVKYQSLTENAGGVAYFLLPQYPLPASNLLVRTSVGSQNITPSVRGVLREAYPNLPVDDVVSLEEHISRSLIQQKLIARLATFFGLLALLLASIGLYGVLSYSVAQRGNEIGIRLALGASRLDVIKMVLRSGMTMTIIGLVLGVGGAFALTRVVKSLLFGVESTDAMTFIAVSAGLVIVALIACYIPARRATYVDPLTALRSD